MNRQAPRVDFDEAAQSAIEWAVLLRSGEMNSDDQRAFDRWLSGSDKNHAAWLKLQSALAPFSRAAANGSVMAREALTLTNASKRKFLRNSAASVAVLGISGLAGAALWQRQTDAQYALNVQTGTGERRDIVLADRTHLFVNAKSTVRARDGSFRTLQLRSGTMYADVAADRRGSLFSVQTDDGWVRTTAAAMEIATSDDGTLVSVQRSHAVIETLSGLRAMLQPGDVVRFSRESIKRISSSIAAGPSWPKGLFVASDVQLSTVIDALRPYYRGFIRITPDAASRRVSGVFQLDDTRQALDQIAQTLPVNVSTYANCIVMISAR